MDAWIENDNNIAFAYILMKHYQNNLRKVIEDMPIVFQKNHHDEKSNAEIFFCIELFKEIIDCIDYLQKYQMTKILPYTHFSKSIRYKTLIAL